MRKLNLCPDGASLRAQQLLHLQDTSSLDMLPIFQTSSGDLHPPVKFLSALNCLVVVIYTSIKLHLEKENGFDSIADIIYACFRVGMHSIYATGEVYGMCIPTSTELMTMRTAEMSPGI